MNVVLPEVASSAAKAAKGNSCLSGEALNSLHLNEKKIIHVDNLVVCVIFEITVCIL